MVRVEATTTVLEVFKGSSQSIAGPLNINPTSVEGNILQFVNITIETQILENNVLKLTAEYMGLSIEATDSQPMNLNYVSFSALYLQSDSSQIQFRFFNGPGKNTIYLLHFNKSFYIGDMNIYQHCYPIVDCREDRKINFYVEGDNVFTRSYQVYVITGQQLTHKGRSQ